MTRTRFISQIDLLQLQSLCELPSPRPTVLPEGQLEHHETVPPALYVPGAHAVYNRSLGQSNYHFHRELG